MQIGKVGLFHAGTHAGVQGIKTVDLPKGLNTTDLPKTDSKINALSFMGYYIAHKTDKSYEQKFILPDKIAGGNFAKLIEDKEYGYRVAAQDAIKELNERAGKEGQFLNWVQLPSKQLEKKANGKSHVDEIYEQAQEMIKRGDKDKPLVVLGIGGSKHTVEFLKNMANQNSQKIILYSDIDPISFEMLKDDLKGDFRNANYLVASKSGKTFETKDAFIRVQNEIRDALRKDIKDEDKVEDAMSSYFAICTDKKASKGNLREQVGDVNGEGNQYIKELYIHDDVGGRYSMFDDAGIFALAYAGVPKDYTERILKAASEVSKKATSDKIIQNDAIQSAIYNVFCRKNGYKMTTNQFFGKLFESGGENWMKQLYLESLKDFNFSAQKSPDAMHYASEGLFKPENTDDYNVIMTTFNQGISNNYKKYTNAIAKAYSANVPTKIEMIETEGKSLKPEAIGKYVQNKMFETIYTGMLLRSLGLKEGEVALCEALPEVLQPCVETYKSEFRSGENQVIPGDNSKPSDK